MRRANKTLGDERGSFTEIWRASLTRGLSPGGFVQGNVSVSRPGVLRGMHFHRRQSDLWTIVAGRALAATTNLRDAVDGLGPVRSQVSDLAFGDSLFIPPYVAHGFWALEE